MSERLPFRPLVDAGLAGSQNTTKQMVFERPDLIIRSNPGDSHTFNEAKQLQAEYASLNKDYGISTPFVNIVLGEGFSKSEIFIVVEKIKGENLERAFMHPTSDLVEKYQLVSIGLTKYMVDRAKPGRSYLRDISSLGNFVYGTQSYDNEPQVYLVDLEYTFCGFKLPKNLDNGSLQWLGWFASIINSVTEAEHLGKIHLPKARKALKAVLDDLPGEEFGLEPLNYLKSVLRNNQTMDQDILENYFG